MPSDPRGSSIMHHDSSSTWHVDGRSKKSWGGHKRKDYRERVYDNDGFSRTGKRW